MTKKVFPLETLIGFCHRVFEGYGFSSGDAAIITDVILRADLYGVESHGLSRLVRYDEEIKCGHVDVGARAVTVHETPVSAVLDGQKAMGQLTAYRAMRLAIEKAKKTGIGMVAVRNSNHYGIAGFYTRVAAGEDLIGISTTNTEAICVPTFGRRPMLGTNPVAFAMPASPCDFSFDAAMTVVPRGKLEVYRDRGEELPSGWALDEAGRPSTDAGHVIDVIINKLGGGIVPLGGTAESGSGYKGYGLAAIVEITSAILSGGLTSNRVNVKPGEAAMCHSFCAVDYGLFGDKAAIKAALSAYLQEIRDSPKAAGRSRIYTHGERASETEALRRAEGIPVGEKTLLNLNRIGARFGVSL